MKKICSTILALILAFSSISALAQGNSLNIMGNTVMIDGVKQPSALNLFISYGDGSMNLSNTSISAQKNLIESEGDFVIDISGTNVLSTGADYALMIKGSLTIQGDGVLDCTSEKAAIYVEGDVTISGGTVIAKGTGEDSYGIYATGTITVEEGVNLTAEGTAQNTVSEGEILTDTPAENPEDTDDPEDNENPEDTDDPEDNENPEDTDEPEDTEKPNKKPSGTPSGKAPVLKPTETEETPKKPAFTDVSVSDWFCQYVTPLYEKNIVHGYPDGTFKPEGNVTYGEALKLIFLAAGLSEMNATGTHWASGYLSLVANVGILPQDQNLDEPIKRGVVAKISKLFLSLPAPKEESPFADTDDASAVSLYEAGIMEGSFTEDGKRVFLPDSEITRAEISAIVYRMIK